jgi:hypothetical protein
LRQFDDEEVPGGIQVVLAGLVNDAKMLFLLGSLVRHDRIDLANFQILAALVLEANGEPSRGCVFRFLSQKCLMQLGL